MDVRRWFAYPLAALLLATIVLSGCGANPAAQAEQSTTTDILPTPVPIPTGLPQPPTPTPPPAPTSPPSLASANTLLTNDFNTQTDLSGWSVIDASDLIQQPSIWSISGGHLLQVSDGDGIASLYATALVTGQPDWTNYSVSAAAFDTGNDEFGLVVRANDQGYYVFRLLPAVNSAPKYILSRYDAKAVAFTDIAKTASTGFKTRRWYQLRVTVQGDTIQGFVDGQPVIEAHDTTFTQGRTGVYGYAQGDLQFDNFSVQAIQ